MLAFSAASASFEGFDVDVAGDDLSENVFIFITKLVPATNTLLILFGSIHCLIGGSDEKLQRIHKCGKRHRDRPMQLMSITNYVRVAFMLLYQLSPMTKNWLLLCSI